MSEFVYAAKAASSPTDPTAAEPWKFSGPYPFIGYAKSEKTVSTSETSAVSGSASLALLKAAFALKTGTFSLTSYPEPSFSLTGASPGVPYVSGVTSVLCWCYIDVPATALAMVAKINRIDYNRLWWDLITMRVPDWTMAVRIGTTAPDAASLWTWGAAAGSFTIDSTHAWASSETFAKYAVITGFTPGVRNYFSFDCTGWQSEAIMGAAANEIWSSGDFREIPVEGGTGRGVYVQVLP